MLPPGLGWCEPRSWLASSGQRRMSSRSWLIMRKCSGFPGSNGFDGETMFRPGYPSAKLLQAFKVQVDGFAGVRKGFGQRSPTRDDIRKIGEIDGIDRFPWSVSDREYEVSETVGC